MPTTSDTVRVDEEIILRGGYIFNASNDNWSNDPDHNMFFLTAMQSYYNDKLKVVGYVFINDILDQLGIPKTRSGQLLGWGNLHNGHIDFGIVEHMGGYILAFNHEGVILNLLEEYRA